MSRQDVKLSELDDVGITLTENGYLCTVQQYPPLTPQPWENEVKSSNRFTEADIGLAQQWNTAARAEGKNLEKSWRDLECLQPQHPAYSWKAKQHTLSKSKKVTSKRQPGAASRRKTLRYAGKREIAHQLHGPDNDGSKEIDEDSNNTLSLKVDDFEGLKNTVVHHQSPTHTVQKPSGTSLIDSIVIDSDSDSDSDSESEDTSAPGASQTPYTPTQSSAQSPSSDATVPASSLEATPEPVPTRTANNSSSRNATQRRPNPASGPAVNNNSRPQTRSSLRTGLWGALRRGI